MFAKLRTVLRTVDKRIKRRLNRRRLRKLITLAQEYIRRENDGIARAIHICEGVGPVLDNLPSPEVRRELKARGFDVSDGKSIHYRKRVIPVILILNTNLFLNNPFYPDRFP